MLDEGLLKELAALKAMACNNTPTCNWVTVDNISPSYPFVSFVTTTEQRQTVVADIPKENTMYFNTENECGALPNNEGTQRNYLLERLSNMRSEKGEELQRTYGLYDDNPPTTPDEAVKRIQDGKIVVCPFDAKKKTFYTDNLGTYIRWRDPSVVEDRKGYEKAYAALLNTARSVKDTVVIKSVEDGLKALQDFESTTFH